MKKRQKEADDAYEAMWDGGRGSHHPDYDPTAAGDDIVKGSRATDELYNAIVKNDIQKVYEKIEEGADVNFVFQRAYRSQEGYTPLMVAAHRCAAPQVECLFRLPRVPPQSARVGDARRRLRRGRYECARALLRAGADPNYTNGGHDLAVFWAIDGGVDMTRLLHECGPSERAAAGSACLCWERARRLSNCKLPTHVPLLHTPCFACIINQVCVCACCGNKTARLPPRLPGTTKLRSNTVAHVPTALTAAVS